MGGKKINLKFNFPAEKTRELRELAEFSSAKFLRGEIWRAYQDEITDYFAQHPEVIL